MSGATAYKGILLYHKRMISTASIVGMPSMMLVLLLPNGVPDCGLVEEGQPPHP